MAPGILALLIPLALLLPSASSAQNVFPCLGPQGQAGSSLSQGGFCYYTLPMEEFCMELMAEEDTTICLPPISGGGTLGTGVFGGEGILLKLAQGLREGSIRPRSPEALESTRARVSRYLYGILEASGTSREGLRTHLERWERVGGTLARGPSPAPAAAARGAGAMTRPAPMQPGIAALASWLEEESRGGTALRPDP